MGSSSVSPSGAISSLSGLSGGSGRSGGPGRRAAKEQRIHQASSAEAVRKHAAAADLPISEIVPIANTVVVRPDL
jgi:hypothetical protein